MPRLWRALAVVCALSPAAPAGAQADGEFTLIRDWTPVGTADTRAAADTLLLSAGTIHTPDTYADFVFRFDYRLPSTDAGAMLLLHAHGGADGEPREYAVALDGTGNGGRLSAVRLLLHETRFTPVGAPRGDWTPCEVRVEGGRLTVSLAGAVVAEADRLDSPGGRIGFRAGRRGIELRGMRVAPLAKPASTFHPELPKADAPGITQPRITKHVGPIYPNKAHRQGISGIVLLAIVIGTDGLVGDLHVAASAHPDLIEPAIACVRKWRFHPATKDGVPTAVTATVEVAFALARR
jgi:TonB family protein